MTIAPEFERITADDETIRKALLDAFLPALIPALAQATGDLSILREDMRPPGFAPGVPQGGMTPVQQAAARIVAFEALRALRDGSTAAPSATESDLRTITQWMTASATPSDYIPLLVARLDLVTFADLALAQSDIQRVDLCVVAYPHDPLQYFSTFDVTYTVMTSHRYHPE